VDILTDPTRWWAQAECLEEDPELFYPAHRKEREELEREALLVCGMCPVRVECLQDELRHGEANQHGTRGGMTEGERRALLRSQRRAIARSARAGVAA